MIINAQINNFKITKQVGSGAFGLVYHCIDLSTKREFAMKAILKQQDLPKDMMQNNKTIKKSSVLQQQLYHFFKSYAYKVFLPSINLESLKNMPLEQLTPDSYYYKEIILHLRSNDLPNVVKIFEVLESSIAIFTIMEYFPMDLFTSIVDQQHFAHNPLLVKKVFIQLAGLIKNLAAIDVYHCDIKPENILLDSNDNVKLCDFGLATDKVFLNFDTCVGSSYYMAPERVSGSSEIIKNHVINSKVNDKIKIMMSLSNGAQYPTIAGDVWSLTIILMNLLTTRNPWLKASPSDSTFSHFINNKKVLSKILELSNDMLELLIGAEAMGTTHKIKIDFNNDPLASVKLHGMMSLNPWERSDPEVLEYFLRTIAKSEQFLKDTQDLNHINIKGGSLGVCRPLEDFEVDKILKRNIYHTNFSQTEFDNANANFLLQRNKLDHKDLSDVFDKNSNLKSSANIFQPQNLNTLVNSRENTMKSMSSRSSTISQSNNLFDNQQKNYLNFNGVLEQNNDGFPFFDFSLEKEAFEVGLLKQNISLFLNKFKDENEMEIDMLMKDSVM
ncbi:hypothetical protein QEN19_002048 [Hanseniaspora menglaensis]